MNETPEDNETPQDNEYSGPLEFPCDFVIKAMGAATEEFESIVRNIIKSHFPKCTADMIKKRYSKDHNYVALSITVHAKNKAQLDSTYEELSARKEVLMAL